MRVYLPSMARPGNSAPILARTAKSTWRTRWSCATRASIKWPRRPRFSRIIIYGADKARAIEQLARSAQIDLGASYAYSDSASDLPMLRLVGHPVAVNPDLELARVARAEGWEILRFDRLGRRLKAAAALAGAAVAGGVGSAALAARARRLGRPASSRARRLGRPAAG
jgi:hypothetical protein